MEVTFAKVDPGFCETSVVRSDGVRLAVPTFGPMRHMPHDLVHFVVESELEVERGFWGCIAAGAVFRGMRVLAGRRRPHADERSRAILERAGQRLVESEELVRIVLQAAVVERASSGELARRLARAFCPHGKSRGEIGLDAARRVGAALLARRSEWAELASGAALRLRWPLREAGTISRSARRPAPRCARSARRRTALPPRPR
jgi:hypothetical protein